MDSASVRRSFLDFFASRGHAVRPSTPIVPQGDATLMFNSAGMVPFKPYFLGIKKDLSRAASCQKCFRTTDIDRVGHTIRHLTFFEMLGNFSFGDYFKEDAIAWAWAFLTKDMGLDPARLHPSVFKDDEEAFAIWTKLGAPNKPVRLGEDSNFWNMGPTGPCGPCSEIYFDRGPGASNSCGKPGCGAGCDCDRHIEIWNLVFTQFDRQPDGGLKPLPRKNIDTGMGLERLAFVAGGKGSPFDTDLFLPIMDAVRGVIRPSAADVAPLALRVIADHARAVAFLMSEGIIPSNVERGYVLRRLIRRAVRYGQLLGHKGPFLHSVLPAVTGIFGGTYPGIAAASGSVAETLRMEEERFLTTLEAGERELEGVLSKCGGCGGAGKLLPGAAAFKLYDTFGFPLELTREICAGRGVAVDEDGYKEAVRTAAEVARASWKGSGAKNVDLGKLALPQQPTRFTGYESVEEPAEVLACSGDVVILDRTPFYAESGGQVGDQGAILSRDGRTVLAKVLDTQKHQTAILHIVEALPGRELEPGLPVLARVDELRRSYIRPHHTATHLLNAALRAVLGTHVRQAGSYVGPDKLRFDFTHPKALDDEDLRAVEDMVNAEIAKAQPVATKVDTFEKAKELGAMMLLGEEYGERPRMVLVGPKGWADPLDRCSMELCGGTHVANTSEIAAFKVLKESSVAAGIRRIEALAGPALGDHRKAQELEESRLVAELARRVKARDSELRSLGGAADDFPLERRTAAELRSRERELASFIARLRERRLSSAADAGKKIVEIGAWRLLAQRLEGGDPKSLRSIADRFKAEVGSGVVFLASAREGKLSFVLAVAGDAASKALDAAGMAKSLAKSLGGSAGGRADFAQGGLGDADWDGIVSRLVGIIGGEGG
ncbi:MAG: alanine--tRNA ligase [Elusimicrobia bacterium]|nr:alanine--tRNA ligase [Elusimicrobiota bacterium]